jgi:ethanolamine utilization protein EutN
MILGRVVGNAVSTVKHASLIGQRLLTVQPLRSGSNDPVLAVDALGAGIGSVVVMTNDGKSTREMIGDDTSPVRWAVMGIVDASDD